MNLWSSHFLALNYLGEEAKVLGVLTGVINDFKNSEYRLVQLDCGFSNCC